MKKFFTALIVLSSVLFSNSTKEQLLVLRLNMSQEFHQKDPRKAGDLASNSIHFQLHEGLMKMSPDHKEAIGGIAKSYELDSTQTIYIFHLDERYYSNGEKITAYDFEKSWKELLNPNFNCPNVHLFFPISNAKEAKLGLCSIETVGIQALNDKTLKITLKHPFKPFLEALCFVTFSAFKNESIYSGPFCIDHFQLHHLLKLVKNPYYPHENKEKTTIEISFIKDEMTAFNLFEKGQLDLIGTPFTHIPKEAIEYFKDKHHLQTQPTLGVCYLLLNKNKSSIFDENFILNLYHQIDRKSLAEDVISKEGKPQFYAVPDEILNEHLLIKKPTSELIKKPIKRLRLIYPQVANYPKIAQFIEQEFQNKFQIQLNLQGMELKVFQQTVAKGDFDLALSTIFAQYRDPTAFLDRFSDPNDPKNPLAFDHKEFQKKLIDANTSFDPSQRAQLLQEAEKILIEEGGLIPLFQVNTKYCIQTNIHEIRINASGGFNFNNLSKKN
jgi:oligopeptide transport system substrate-binding protein